jgi:hypothetical protein
MSGSVTFKGGKKSKAPYIDPPGPDNLSRIAEADGLYYVSRSSGSDDNATTSGGQPEKKKDKKEKKDKVKKKDKEKAKKSEGQKQVRS